MVPVLTGRLVRAVQSDEEIPVRATPNLRALVESGRATRRNGTLSNVEKSARAFAEAGVENAARLLLQIRGRWERWLRNMRIFCASEIYDDLLMWSHYAEQHSGAVIGIRHVDHPEAMLDGVMPVRYQTTIPMVAETAEDWADQLFGTKTLEVGQLFDRLVLTKSNQWHYEREWRCVAGDPSERSTEGLFEFRPFREGEIASVYLGCRISDEHRSQISQAAQAIRDVKIYQARRTPGEFSLTFDPIA